MPPDLSASVSPTARLSAVALCALVVAGLVGGLLTNIEIVARGTGRVVPTTSICLVPALVAGRVDAVLVEQGSSVTKGQILAELDSTAQRADVLLLEDQIARREAEHRRLRASINLVSSSDPASPTFIAKGRLAFDESGLPEAVAGASRGRFEAELASLSADILTLDAEISIPCAASKRSGTRGRPRPGLWSMSRGRCSTEPRAFLRPAA